MRVIKLLPSFTIESPFKDFVLEKANIKEGLSCLLEINAAFFAKIDFNASEMINKEITIKCTYKDKVRYFSGIIFEIENKYLLKNREKAYVKMKIYANVKKLQLENDFKIFKNKTPIEITKEILFANEIKNFVDLTQKNGRNVLEYKVQYNESSFNFISRILEDEGIFYFFDHEKNSHKFVIAENISSINGKVEEIVVKPLASPEAYPGGVFKLDSDIKMSPKKVIIKDYDYMNPSAHLIATAESSENDEVNNKHNNKYDSEQNNKHNDKYGGSSVDFGEIFEYPGNFKKTKDGDFYSKIRLEEITSDEFVLNGEGSDLSLFPGKTVKIPGKGLFYVLNIEHYLSNIYSNDEMYPNYKNLFTLIPISKPFRPKRNSYRPKIYGVQSAIVIGPPNEEVYVDELGRIKVKFFWENNQKIDTHLMNSKGISLNSNSIYFNHSCWIRVVQNLSGANFGGVITPRVGMEVLVSFIDGDPDKPLVIGCLYNAKNKIGISQENIYCTSSFKTKTIGGDGYNEVQFIDKKHEESIFIKAQKNMTTLINESKKISIEKGNYNIDLDQGSMQITQKGKETSYIHEILNGRYLCNINKGDFEVNLFSGDLISKIKKGNAACEIDDGNSDLEIKSGNNSTILNKGNILMFLKEGNNELNINKGSQNISVNEGNRNVLLKKGVDFISIKDGEKNISINKGNALLRINKGNNDIVLDEGDDNTTLNSGDMTIQIKNGKYILDVSNGDVILSAKNIKVKSFGNIDFNASENIKFNAGANIEFKSGALFKITSESNINIESGANFEITSKARTEISAGTIAKYQSRINTEISSYGVVNLKGTAVTSNKKILTT